MKYLNPIKGIIAWTWSCIEVWFNSLGDVCTTESTYWSQTQTFFQGEGAKENRKRYREAEIELFNKFKSDTKD